MTAPVEGTFTNITFLYDNLLKTATITTFSAARKFPKENIVQKWLTNAYRSDTLGVDDEWLKADLGSAQAVKAFIVSQHNFDDGCTSKIQGNAADAWGAPTVDEAITHYGEDYLISYFWSTSQTYQWWNWLIDVGDFTSGETYVKAGLAFLGDYFRPASNFNRKYVEGRVDQSQKTILEHGNIFSMPSQGYDTWSYTFEGLSAADVGSFQAMYDVVGSEIPFFIVENQGRWYDKTFYVVFSGELKYQHVAREDTYNVEIEVREVQ